MRENFDVLDVRLATSEADGSIEALAVKFGVVDSYGTSFQRGAFTGLSRKLPMLWSHDPSQVIGHWSELSVDDTGLRAKGLLNLAIGRAVEVRSMVAAGDIDGISIGFQTLKSEWQDGVRHITKVQLYEISLVAMASVPGAKVTKVRSLSPGATAGFLAAVNAATSALKGTQK
jgi:HK97 family phage prohead protease